ncbi:MAG TPA: hypothetical protein DDW68_00285 [Verrucomicrobiales bacterium]|jgi:hypothetical protein|nr:hypothetical protein [Verrucomicrobiales bacterium]HBE95592.1 hypothetical protein [Verrucomicrobiales bacterium]
MAGNCVSLNTVQNIPSIPTITFKACSSAINTVKPKGNTTKPQQGPPQIQNQLVEDLAPDPKKEQAHPSLLR